MPTNSIDNMIPNLTTSIIDLTREIQSLNETIKQQHVRPRPWRNLPRQRMLAVESTYLLLRKNMTLTIRKASQLAYTKAEGGYPNWESLAAYCYSIDLKRFATLY